MTEMHMYVRTYVWKSQSNPTQITWADRESLKACVYLQPQGSCSEDSADMVSRKTVPFNGCQKKASVGSQISFVAFIRAKNDV